jgi:hypothetical protein
MAEEIFRFETPRLAVSIYQAADGMVEIELRDKKLGLTADLKEHDAKALFEEITHIDFLSNMVAQHYTNRSWNPTNEQSRDPDR